MFRSEFEITGKKKNWDERALIVLLVVSIAVLAFYRLGNGEIQSWDEAMYLIRADACTRWHAWLDQTSYSVGGLYSSTHPLLGIWLFAITRTLFGVGSFASRLPSAFGYLLSVVSLYVIARQFVSKGSAIVGAASLAAAQTYVWYAHHAQLDSMLMGWTLAGLALLITRSSDRGIMSAIFAGLAFGCALLTKFAFGLYVLPFVGIYALLDRSQWKRVVIFCSVGIAVALPWYLWMHAHYPDFGIHAEQLANNGAYENSTSYSWWYYFNQCVVNVPLIVPAFLAILFSCTRHKKMKMAGLEGQPWLPKPTYPRNKFFTTSLIWFAAAFVVLEFMRTKMPHFALLLFPPAALLLAYGFEVYPERRLARIAVVASGVLSVLWSLSEQARLWVTSRLFVTDIVLPKPYLLVLISLFIAALVFYLLRGPSKTKLAIASSLFLTVIQIFRWTSYSNNFADDGARQVIEKIKDPAIQNITVLCEQAPHALLIPQLVYYRQMHSAQDDLLRTSQSVQSWRSLDWDAALMIRRDSLIIPNSAIIISRKKDRLSRIPSPDSLQLSQLQGLLGQKYPHALHSRSYDLYY